MDVRLLSRLCVVQVASTATGWVFFQRSLDVIFTRYSTALFASLLIILEAKLESSKGNLYFGVPRLCFIVVAKPFFQPPLPLHKEQTVSITNTISSASMHVSQTIQCLSTPIVTVATRFVLIAIN